MKQKVKHKKWYSKFLFICHCVFKVFSSSHRMCLSYKHSSKMKTLLMIMKSHFLKNLSLFFSLFLHYFKEYHLVDLEFLCELFGKFFYVNVVCYRFELINIYYRNKNILLKSIWWCFYLFSCSLLLVGSWILLALFYPNVIRTISV